MDPHYQLNDDLYLVPNIDNRFLTIIHAKISEIIINSKEVYFRVKMMESESKLAPFSDPYKISQQDINTLTSINSGYFVFSKQNLAKEFIQKKILGLIDILKNKLETL